MTESDKHFVHDNMAIITTVFVLKYCLRISDELKKFSTLPPGKAGRGEPEQDPVPDQAGGKSQKTRAGNFSIRPTWKSNHFFPDYPLIFNESRQSVEN